MPPASIAAVNTSTSSRRETRTRWRSSQRRSSRNWAISTCESSPPIRTVRCGRCRPARSGPDRPFPLGPEWDGHGTNFSLFSENAERVELCLFDADGAEERIELRERTAFNWHCYLPGVGPGQHYGYRVHGPYDPERGLRFNPAKLLIDPYAKAIDGPVRWTAANVLPYVPGTGDDDADLRIDETDSAAAVPKSVVVDPAFDWQDDELVRPRTPLHETVIYEMHVKGFTRRREGVREDLRGTYGGLASEDAVAYLQLARRDRGRAAARPPHRRRELPRAAAA